MRYIYDIFISYRRVDSEGRTSGRYIARTIKLEFKNRGYEVFFDYSEIKDNEFEDVIIPALQNSTVFILVLSKDALLRCVNEKDWVRREIETALNCGCKIIPVSPDGAFDGWPSVLPDSIFPITKLQVSEISMGSLFEKSIDKLEHERIKDFIKEKSAQQEDIELQNINNIFRSLNGWLKHTHGTIVSSWTQRSIITNIIFCLYILPSFLLSFFLVDFNHRSIYFLEVSIGFYAISFLYCIFQYLLNRRDGVYIIMLSPIVVVLAGFFMCDRYSDHLWDSTYLLILFSIPMMLSLLIRKNRKSTWEQMNGGVFGLLKWKRHFIFYLWCIVWTCMIVYKKPLIL